MTPARAPHAIRLDALVAACLVSLAAGLAGGLGWRWLSIWGLDVPGTTVAIESPALFLNAVVPVVGNGLGYFMSYRRASRRSLPMFVVPGVLLAGVGVTVSLAQLPASPETNAVIATVVATIITPVIVMVILLSRQDLLCARPVPV